MLILQFGIFFLSLSVVCLDFKCISQLIPLSFPREQQKQKKSYSSIQFFSLKKPPKPNTDVKDKKSREICLGNVIQIQVRMGY